MGFVNDRIALGPFAISGDYLRSGCVKRGLPRREQGPRCGEVDVPAKDVLLSVITETEGGYGFRCPACRDVVWKEDERSGVVVGLLLGFGFEDIQTIAGAT